ncbi:hypothetical protein [Escherichia coli]|uniref:hypothetical protein n=1 Tax=Escherichia coli TaxID=562 RepID=UPI000CFAAE5F|nr:hypothetical protein [Escherichia coli]
MIDEEKIDLMVKEIKKVIFEKTGEDSKVNIIEIDGCRRINILIDNISSYLIKFSEQEYSKTKI